MIIRIKISDLPDLNSYKIFDYPAYKIELLVLNSNNSFKVIDSFCPHYGGKLQFLNNQFLCSFHGYKFDMNTLECINRDVNLKCTNRPYKMSSQEMLIEIE